MTLTLTDCTFAYRRANRPVLENLTYSLPAGLTILLGPNGAGKSTLLKLAASVTRPVIGNVSIGGVESGQRDFRKMVAWMPQQITAMTGLTAREQVAYTGWLKGMNRSEAWNHAEEALALVDLREQTNKRASQLSGGQLRRLGVASALVHKARILLLDEPTAGMDPTQRRTFRDVLTTIVGTSQVRVLMSTHDVADLATDADYVTVLHQGRIRYHGTSESFLGHAPHHTPSGRCAEAAYTALTQ